MLHCWVKFWFAKWNSLDPQEKDGQENDAILQCLQVFLIPCIIHVSLPRTSKLGVWAQSPCLNWTGSMLKLHRKVIQIRNSSKTTVNTMNTSVKTKPVQLVPSFYMKIKVVYYGWREYKSTWDSSSSPTSLDIGHFLLLAYRPPD